MALIVITPTWDTDGIYFVVQEENEKVQRFINPVHAEGVEAEYSRAMRGIEQTILDDYRAKAPYLTFTDPVDDDWYIKKVIL